MDFWQRSLMRYLLVTETTKLTDRYQAIETNHKQTQLNLQATHFQPSHESVVC